MEGEVVVPKYPERAGGGFEVIGPGACSQVELLDIGEMTDLFSNECQGIPSRTPVADKAGFAPFLTVEGQGSARLILENLEH